MGIMEDFNQTVDYIDASLGASADDREIRRLSGYSRAMFSRVFSIFTGMTLSEYIRGRRLTEAAFDLRSSEERVIDVALRYGFGSPDSFAAAFKEFHGRTPSEVRDGMPFRVMSKLRLALSVRGGEEMKVSIQKKPGFIVAGLMREAIESSECPALGTRSIRIGTRRSSPHSEAAKATACASTSKIRERSTTWQGTTYRTVLRHGSWDLTSSRFPRTSTRSSRSKVRSPHASTVDGGT